MQSFVDMVALGATIFVAPYLPIHSGGCDASCYTIAGYCFYSAEILVNNRRRVINLVRHWYAQHSGLHIVLMNAGLVCLQEHLKNVLTERLLCLLIKSGIASHIKVFLMLPAHQRYLSTCKIVSNYMTAYNLQTMNMLIFLYIRQTCEIQFIYIMSY